MANVSVLMSVYNERSTEIIEAIESILNQSFTDFELLIVCDNPSNIELISLLEDIKKKDSRIKIIINKENIGLALSLNTAFAKSTGDYIIRMDADDISMLDRFEKQVEIMETCNYDVVWTSYAYINENGEQIGKVSEYIKKEDISRLLPLKNIIHHPTVIIKREALEKAGLYRNFPCAQDYDLWLRMLNNNCNFYMMPDCLLYYRVRSNSISSKRKYQQLCTLNYIRGLYFERQKRGEDTYSYEAYLSYIKKFGVGNIKIESNYEIARTLVSLGKDGIKNKNYISAVSHFINAIFLSKYYRHSVVLYFKRKLRV